MNKFSKITIKLAAVTQILAITLLAACTSTGPTTPSTVCHATGGDAANGYEEITVTAVELKDHRGHPNDIIPVPANGCPTGPVVIRDGKITICHATASEANPYNEITVSVNGLNGHGAHEGDIFPLPEGGCPPNSGVIGNGATPSTVCHATDDPENPYEQITVNSAEFKEHLGHPNDINPALATGCPTSPMVIRDGKITFCHASSKTNPYNEITVSVNGLNGHGRHEGDVFPLPEGSCPPSPLSDDKITICHATSSKTNPYNEITVSVNGLNGHDKHEGDIIPAPEGGCPATSP